MVPLRVRGYAIERYLGSGASSDVWQARVLASGAPVALKRIAIRDDEQRRRAQTEAALLGALEHPNLVRLHSTVRVDEDLVLVLDLAEGGSLAGLLHARERLTPGEVITAVAPVAAALEYLHAQGVVHGDVSAANVLFTASGVPMLADVGVARLTGDDADAEATPAYVDPAVAAGCVPGPPSDVFMLAGVALHALTGAPPWPDPDAAAALARAALGVLGDVQQRLRDAAAPDAMAAVLCRAMSVDPHRRGSAADLALDLAHSGEPLAVELAAGLAQLEPRPIARPGPRHAATMRGGVDPAGASAPPRDAARPAFERPAPAAAKPGGPPPTRMVGPRPRPVIPRPPRRRGRLGPMAAVVALALGLAALGVSWAGSSGSTRARSTPHPQPQVETRSAPGAGTRPPASAIGWAANLGRLDRLRARAFAMRTPALLGRVYVRGPLLAADSAQLARIVPAGCGLAGVRTRFAHLRVIDRGVRAVVIAVATLPPSRLLCRGHARANASGAGPSRLRIELIRTGHGVRISAERLLSPARSAAHPPDPGN